MVGVIVLFFGKYSRANWSEKDFSLTLRASADEFLLQIEDSTSRVLPVEKVGDRFKVSFDSHFSFVPDDLMFAVIKIFEQNKVSKDVIVETVECISQRVVHSFKVTTDTSDMLACKERALPTGCYEIYFSLKKDDNVLETTESTTSEGSNPWWLILLGAASALGIFFYIRSTKKQVPSEDVGIPIGAYLFDKSAMRLSFEGTQTELSGKETDLLFLLISNQNETVLRETILNTVWGDEGNYVGRTLDVFISKLRKKLQGDANVKIANVRGVGYKLIVD